MFIAPAPKDYRSSFRSEMLIDKLKYVFVFERNLKLLQSRQILILEGSPMMMPFLALNVADDCVEL